MAPFEEGLLEKRDSFLEEKQRKIREFRSLKHRLAFLNRRDEKTPEQFDKYIKTLFDGEQCKYMTGIKDVVALCNHNIFDCSFRSRDNFNFHGKLKFECLREKTLNLKRLF